MSLLHLLAAPPVANLGAVAGYEIGSGRTVPTVVAVLGLVSVVLGGPALTRSRGTGGRAAPVLALVLGPVSVLVGGLHMANSAGGFGTGNGFAGAIVAVLLGLIGTLLGGLALVRSRRPGQHAGSAPLR